MAHKKSVVVVGGGLAGLSAAYDLVKTGDYSVTLLEASDRLGGRIHTLELDHQPVDVGGFMIFPWYRYFLELLDEVGLTDQLRDFKQFDEYYQLAHGGAFVKDTNVPLWQIFPWQMLPKLIIPFFTNRLNFYEPDLELLNGVTAKQAFDDETGQGSLSETHASELATSYTYGDLEDIPVGLYLGFGYKLLTHHGFDRCQFIVGGTERLIAALVAGIQANGGNIKTNQAVVAVSPGQIKTEHGHFTADSIILAHGIHDDVVSKAAKFDSDIPKAWYTNHYTVVVKLKQASSLCGSTDWMVAYNHLPDDKQPHIVSIGNLQCVMDDPSEQILLVYIRLHRQDTRHHSDNSIADIAQAQLGNYLEGLVIDKVLAVHHWQQTMPVVDTKLVKTVRQAQGQNGIFFAGDYLGSPCMETAIYSGRKAAQLIKTQC